MGQNFHGGGHAHTLTLRNDSGQAGAKLGLYEESETQTHSLGLAMDRDDGSVFRYSYYVSAVGAGQVSALDISLAGFASIDGKFTDSAGAAKDDYGTDDDVIYLTDTSTFQSENDAADVWAGGLMFITDAAGEGYSYRIKSHTQPEVEPAVAGAVKFTLHDKLHSALDSESSCAVVGHPYRNLAIANNGTDDLVAGVPTRAVTAARYAWTQTWGWANVLLDESAGTIASGTIAQLSDGVNGAAQPFGGGATDSEDDHSYATEAILGHFGLVGADTEYGPVFLRLNP